MYKGIVKRIYKLCRPSVQTAESLQACCRNNCSTIAGNKAVLCMYMCVASVCLSTVAHRAYLSLRLDVQVAFLYYAGHFPGSSVPSCSERQWRIQYRRKTERGKAGREVKEREEWSSIMVGDVITNRNINSPVLGPPTSVMSLYSCTIKFEPLQAKIKLNITE